MVVGSNPIACSMSWPQAVVKYDGKARRLHVHGKTTTGIVGRLSHPHTGPEVEIPYSDVRWVNTEAANAYDIHDVEVVGIGYAADLKKTAYDEERAKKRG